MPPTIRFTRASVLNAAYELVRREGPTALNARAVARELGGSTQPIFRLFSSMDELRTEIIRLADANIVSCIKAQASNSRNPYISICMSYLLFARDEPQLFKLLFMRDRVSDGSCSQNMNGNCSPANSQPPLGYRQYTHEWGFPVIESSFNVDHETAIRLYERNFFYVHGLAVCIATKYMPLMDEAYMEALITESVRAAVTQLDVCVSNL